MLTMQIVIWIVIILLAIFLIWLLKKWIKRIIFILILLALAFLIYGIFYPSWAARLWYNVRTFPQRVTSRISSGKEFLDYDSYKLNLPSVWDGIGLLKDEADDKLSDIRQEFDVDLEFDDRSEDDQDESYIKLENVSDNEEKKVSNNEEKNAEKQIIKVFPRTVKFVELPSLKEDIEAEDSGILAGYQKSDLLWVINKYIENNLDDDTDILVTVEYEEDGESPGKIILQAQPKVVWRTHSVLFSGISANDLDDLLESEETEEIIVVPDEDIVIEKPDTQEKNSKQSSNKKVSNKVISTKLTQKDQQEAEEIFSILF